MKRIILMLLLSVTLFAAQAQNPTIVKSERVTERVTKFIYSNGAMSYIEPLGGDRYSIRATRDDANFIDYEVSYTGRTIVHDGQEVPEVDFQFKNAPLDLGGTDCNFKCCWYGAMVKCMLDKACWITSGGWTNVPFLAGVATACAFGWL